jgi:hypothetical protein
MENTQHTLTVKAFLEAVGRKRVQASLGVSEQLLSRAAVNNRFPAHWFFGLRDLCVDLGQECPEYLFRRDHGRAVNTKHNVDLSDSAQGQENLQNKGAA